MCWLCTLVLQGILFSPLFQTLALVSQLTWTFTSAILLVCSHNSQSNLVSFCYFMKALGSSLLTYSTLQHLLTVLLSLLTDLRPAMKILAKSRSLSVFINLIIAVEHIDLSIPWSTCYLCQDFLRDPKNHSGTTALRNGHSKATQES